MEKKKLIGHAAMLGAEFMWGAAAPLGKVILLGGISSMLLTDFRMIGAAILFWVLSLFTTSEKVSRRDLISMFFASMFGIVVNQVCFMFGLNLTSPINASIITTSMPIITMVLAAIILREAVTKLKVIGVLLGASGASILILSNTTGESGGSAIGDLLVMTAQLSFSFYLVLYKDLITRYSAITLMKWMFTFASIVVLPFSIKEFFIDWTAIDSSVILGIAAYVVGPTFISYLLLPLGQRSLRPTVTAMYNYVQPIVASIIAIIAGLGNFTVASGAAIVLVFTGVYLVTQSKATPNTQAKS